jgi:hypothetical protein
MVAQFVKWRQTRLLPDQVKEGCPAVTKLHCSFCKKSQDEVAHLVAGPEGLAVCDECVALLSDVIAEKDDNWRKRQLESLKKRTKASDTEDGTPRRFQVDLFIVHPALDPAEITAALGLEAQYIHRFGAPRGTPAGNLLPGTFQDTRWRYSVRYEGEDQWFAERFTEFVDRLKPHKAFLSSLRSAGGKASMIIQFLGDGYFGDEILRETLAKLADLELDFGIECFVVPQS